MLGHDENGIPIMTIKQKLEALTYCANMGNGEEDVLGHLGDLFHYFLDWVNEGLVEDGEKPLTPEEAFQHYCKKPTPIIGPTVLDRIVKKLD